MLETPQKGFASDLVEKAKEKLDALHAAQTLQDLRTPPGNKTKKLKGQEERWQFRVNDQYRVRFTAVQTDPLIAEDVQVADFHDD